MKEDVEMNQEVINQELPTDSTMIVLEADESPIYTIEDLWDMMPTSDKVRYGNSIEYYRHRKMVQALLLK
jgi:hypothetical protein